MELILLEKVKNLGNLGDRISVKSGFGRNYLVPQKKAVPATKENIVHFEQQRAELEKKEAKNFASAQQRAALLQDINLVIPALTSDEGRLYGSVGINEIKDALAEKSVSINRSEIVLTDGPIHFVGSYVVELHLHSDIIAKLQVQVISSK